MDAIAEKITHLQRALDLAEGRFDPASIEAGRETIATVTQRRNYTTDRTVVALFGATGSGKSSLANALTETNHARVAHTRPTTTQPLAFAAQLDTPAAALLDWMEISKRAHAPNLDRELILVDLPDVDSVERSHRELSAKMARIVDVLIWVLDPQKYADDVVHSEFLAPLARHAEVTLVVLNQCDRLDRAALPGVLDDIHRLLAADGLPRVEVVPTSALTGAGISKLAAKVRDIAANQRENRAKAAADLDHAARQLLPHDEHYGELAGDGEVIDAAARAAGMGALATAVRRSYLRRANAATGWPFVRWVTKFRPDPLKRLHLGVGARKPGERVTIPAVTSLPAPTPVQAANVRATAHDFVLRSSAGLPLMWRQELLADTQSRIPQLIDSLDRSLAMMELPMQPPPWWRVFGVGQIIAMLMTLLGGGWLLLAGFGDYLRLGLGVPTWHDFPIPTLLLLVGVGVGLLLAAIGNAAARIGANRRASRTEKLVRKAVSATVGEQLIAPTARQLEDYHQFVRSAKQVLTPS
ncbi:MAG: 50S ribosome-binding GTPase [Bowdeniella nasicola]|nr:50S ribosome-binding GTPase [Bowdeniella nasicola]